MSLKIRFRFGGRCSVHPRYNPEKDGRPKQKDCPGCDSIWVIFLYTNIAQLKAASGEGIVRSRWNQSPCEHSGASAHQTILPPHSAEHIEPEEIQGDTTN